MRAIEPLRTFKTKIQTICVCEPISHVCVKPSLNTNQTAHKIHCRITLKPMYS
jgi:hypothetical protein